MKCIVCGQEITEGALFCEFCGAPQGQPQNMNVSLNLGMNPNPGMSSNPGMNPNMGGNPNPGANPNMGQPGFQGQPQNMNMGQPQGITPGFNLSGNKGAPKAPGNGPLANIPKPVLIIVPIAILLLVLLSSFFILNRRGAGSYKSAVSQFFTAVTKHDSKKLVKVMMPKEMEKALIEEEGFDNAKEFYEELDEIFYDDEDDKIKVRKVNISDKDKLSKKELKDVEETLSDDLDLELDIKEMYSLEVEFEYKEGKDDWDDDSVDFLAYKVKGRWYVIPSWFDI